MDSEMTKRLSQQQEKYEAKIIDLTNRLQNESNLFLPSSSSSSSSNRDDNYNIPSDNNDVSSSATVIRSNNNYHHSIEQNTINYLKNIIEKYSVDELKVLLDTVHKLHHDHNNSTSGGDSSGSSSGSSSSSSSSRSSSSSSSKRDVGTISSNNRDEYENMKIVNTWINELINLKEVKSIDIHNVDSIKHHLSSSSSSSNNQIQSSIVITYCIDLIQFLSSQLYSILIKTTTDRDQLHQLESKQNVENEINYEYIRNYEKQCLFSNDPREIKYRSMTMMMEMKKNNNSSNEGIDNKHSSMNHHDNDDNDAGNNDNNDDVKSNKKILKIGSHLASFSKLDALRNINYYQHTNMLNLNFNAATISTSTTIATTTSTTTTNATATMNSTVGLRNATIFGTIPTDKNHTNSMAIKSNDKDSDHINHLNHSHDHHHNDDKDDNYIRSIGNRMDIVMKYNTVDELLSMLNKIKSHALCDIVTLHDYIERKDEALKR